MREVATGKHAYKLEEPERIQLRSNSLKLASVFVRNVTESTVIQHMIEGIRMGLTLH